jgi:peroxiredoxin Q/BCP
MKLLTLGALAALAAAVTAARAGEPLKPGDPVPDVTLRLDDGTTLRLREAKRTIVLYFYPKDDTPGCTREACTYRDRAGELAKAGATVIGISFDDAASHKAFKAKHGLPFALATDDGSVAAAFGVAVRGAGPLRFHARDTFVLGADGTIRAVMRGVDPVESVGDVIAALKATG